MSVRIDSISNILEAFILALRFGSDRDESVPESQNGSDDLFACIRCPHCKWRPTRESMWTCWDCDHPEYFYAGCGANWNTFETEGLCPTCLHRWVWTSCLACYLWSRHEDWYETFGS